MKSKVFFVILIFILSAFTLYSQQVIGEINLTEGKVEFIRNNKNIKASPGDDVYNSDYIVTYDKSTAEIALSDNNGTLRIKENSKISVSSYKEKSKTNYNTVMTSGFLTASFAKNKGNNLNVTTSSIVSGVRGTEFNVAASITGETYVNVTEGTVEVQDTEIINKNNSLEMKDFEFIKLEKGQGALKINQQSLDLKKDITDNLDSYKWLVGQKLETQKLKVSINEIDIKLSVLKEKIILLNKRINILNDIDTRLKNTYGKLLDKLQDKFKNTSGYNKYKTELKDLNDKRSQLIDSSVIFLNQYKACYENYDVLIETLKSMTTLDSETLSRYSAKKQKLAEDKQLIESFEDNWNNMIKNYNKSEDVLEKL